MKDFFIAVVIILILFLLFFLFFKGRKKNSPKGLPKNVDWESLSLTKRGRWAAFLADQERKKENDSQK